MTFSENSWPNRQKGLKFFALVINNHSCILYLWYVKVDGNKEKNDIIDFITCTYLYSELLVKSLGIYELLSQIYFRPFFRKTAQHPNFGPPLCRVCAFTTTRKEGGGSLQHTYTLYIYPILVCGASRLLIIEVEPSFPPLWTTNSLCHPFPAPPWRSKLLWATVSIKGGKVTLRP